MTSRAKRLPIQLTWDVYGQRPNSYPVRVRDKASPTATPVPRDLTGTVWECEVRTRPSGAEVVQCDVVVRDQSDPDDGLGWLDVSIPEASSELIRDGHVAELVQVHPTEQSWIRFRIEYHPPITET